MSDLVKRLEENICYKRPLCEGGFCKEEKGCCISEAMNMLKELQHYKDLEEQGRLIVQKQGQWIHEDVDWVCSECGEDAPTIPFKGKQYRANYCSNCGAKMDEVKDERQTD